jgi:hypothetical protein
MPDESTAEGRALRAVLTLHPLASSVRYQLRAALFDLDTAIAALEDEDRRRFSSAFE